MKIVINHVKPEHVAYILDKIRQNRVPNTSTQPSNWYEGIEIHPDEENEG